MFTVESYEVLYPNRITFVVFAVFHNNDVVFAAGDWVNDNDEIGSEGVISNLHAAVMAECTCYGVTLAMVANATGIVELEDFD